MPVKTPKPSAPPSADRSALGRKRDEAMFPVAPALSKLPRDYATLLGALKKRIRETRLRAILSANATMVLLYWDMGKMILERQDVEGWGTKVIDRLSSDLRGAFPDMKGLSSRNLKYMRAFADAWPDRAIVQEALAQIPWFHNCILIDRVADAKRRAWHIQQPVPENQAAILAYQSNDAHHVA
jgi:predicted nuclease of restriction endonuclease-like (RecB) superfamily